LDGYTLALPSGWRRIQVQDAGGDTVAAIVHEAFAEAPPEVPGESLGPLKADLERRLTRMIAEARRSEVTHLYLPVEAVHGTVVAASFVVSEEPVPPGTADPAVIIAELAAAPGNASMVTIDGTAGVRTEQASGPDPSRGIAHGSRRVSYLLPFPGDTGRLLVMAFSTQADGDPGDPYSKILVELFDTIISTFRWNPG